ncbi:MAG TPA: beta-ketoacyl synthase chain length factor [Pseudomonadales bacterium]|nr:beta-ketoacyl synthase chain length factor [Pseudomonadales bacterium]
MDISLKLLQWAAWAPGVTTQDDWRAWARDEKVIGPDGQPALDFVPALARRRMSRVTRMSIQAAENCRGDKRNITTVFASRHGEIQRSFGILESVAAAEPVSPADFSVSVHNTAAGLYSIQRHDRSPSTSISAGVDTLEAAFVETYAQLHGGNDEVLLVMADEPVPSAYREFVDETEYPYALALHLARCDQPALTLALRKRTSTAAHPPPPGTHPLPHALQLLRLLCGSNTDAWGRWQWEYRP